jgi:hypothetical protein
MDEAMAHWTRKYISRLILAGSISIFPAAAQEPPTNQVAPASAIAPASPTSPAPASSNYTSVAPGATAAPGTVETQSGDSPEMSIDPASLLPDLPPLPSHKVSLLGGTVLKLDRLRDQMTIQVFGGGKMKILFDPRTHFYNDGVEASAADLRPGDRVSIDTMLDGNTIFARNIRLKTVAAGESQGIVVSYRAGQGELLMRDALSPRPVKMRLTPQTRVTNHDQAASANDIVDGTLIAVKFGSQKDGDIAREVAILALPNSSFTFVGRVTALDFSTGLLVLDSSTDGKTYEIYLAPSAVAANETLRQSADVTVLTRFEGNRYVAQNVTVH